MFCSFKTEILRWHRKPKSKKKKKQHSLCNISNKKEVQGTTNEVNNMTNLQLFQVFLETFSLLSHELFYQIENTFVASLGVCKHGLLKLKKNPTKL